jgi:hypothetical protein
MKASLAAGQGVPVRSLSVELKLAAAILVAVLALGLVGARLAGEVYERSIAATALDKLRRASDLFGTHERAEIERIGSVLDVISGDRELVDAFAARDRERLLALAKPLLDALRARQRITHWYFFAPDGSVFLRVHRPDMRGDRPERLTLRRTIETGQPFSGIELGKTKYALRVVRPWVVDGKVLGYLELAEEIRNFLGEMKARTGDDYGLAVAKRHLDHRTWLETLDGRPDTWNDRPSMLVVDATSFEDGIVDFDGDLEALPQEGLLLGEVVRGGRTLVRGAFPVRDVNERVVGGLFVLRDDTGDRRAIRGGHLRAALAVFLVHALVFRRLRRLRREMETRAGAAGLPGSRVVDLHSEDEVGRLEVLFDRLLFPLRPPRDGEQGEPRR